MRLLGLSVWLRAKELAGMPVTWPEDYYKGDYIIDIAREMLDANPALVQMPDAEGQDVCYDKAMNDILNGIKDDLNEFRVEHQRWFSEKTLVEGGAVASAFKALDDAAEVHRHVHQGEHSVLDESLLLPRERLPVPGRGVEFRTAVARIHRFLHSQISQIRFPKLYLPENWSRGKAKEGGALGRKLDFLLQEMNREVNTIGSKTPDADAARVVVEMEKIRSGMSRTRR